MNYQFYDAVVVGGGINGLLSSYILSELGYKVALLDKYQISQDFFKGDNRTSAISLGTSDVLEKLGIWSKCSDFACPINYIYVFERGKDSVVEFAKENMGYVVKNSYLKQACLHKNVQYIQGSWTSLTQDENFVYLQTPQISIQAKILIAADGKYSQIAKHSQIGLFNYSYGQSALVFNITHTLPHKNIAIEEFVSNGPLALLPLEDGFSSGVVWTLDKSLADYVFALYKSGEARFLEIFKNELQRMRHIGDFINIAGDVSLYPLSFSFAKKRYKGRILLIGDSYHHIHPVAGQGFNMTIKDAISLRKMGENSLKLGLDIGNFANLETFERECMLEHGLMSLATDGIVRLFSSSNPLLRFTRNFGLATFNQISYLKNITIKQASGERFVKNNF